MLTPENVALVWESQREFSGCNNALMYHLTRREVIGLLQGCYARQIDVADSRAESHSRRNGSSRQDGWNQSQSTQNDVSFSDVIGKTKYDDAINSSSARGSNAARVSTSFSDAFSSGNSTGQGNTASDTDSESLSGSNRTSTNTFGRNAWANGKTHSDSIGASGQTNIYLGFAVPAVGFTSRVTVGFSRDTRSSWAFDARQDKQEGRGESNSKAFSESSSKGTTQNWGSFQSEAHSYGDSGSRMDAVSSSFADSQMTGAGDGTSQTEARARGNSSEQGTSLAHSDGESERTSRSSGFSSSDSARYSQRFKHLAQMYVNETKIIEKLRRVLSGKVGPAVSRARPILCASCGCVVQSGPESRAGRRCGCGGSTHA